MNVVRYVNLSLWWTGTKHIGTAKKVAGQPKMLTKNSAYFDEIM